jgi:hypothetical protein
MLPSPAMSNASAAANLDQSRIENPNQHVMCYARVLLLAVSLLIRLLFNLGFGQSYCTAMRCCWQQHDSDWHLIE